MERFIWLSNQRPDDWLRNDLAGTYAAPLGETECVLELTFDAEGHLLGSFSTEGETLEVRGGLSRTGSIFGFLLEPSAGSPVAIFRAIPGLNGMTLQLDVPDFDELMDLCNLERIPLSKVSSHSASVSGIGEI